MGVTRNVFSGGVDALVCLVGAWLLVEYPYGAVLFALGGFMHWALGRSRQLDSQQSSVPFWISESELERVS
jgi:hypothetical protein